MKLVILGLTITSSWGNGHATTYRSLCRALAERGHEIVFIEKDVEWFRSHRDLPAPDFCKVLLYEDGRELRRKALAQMRDADAVLLGSYFPDGVAAAELLFERANVPVMFYDIDTPVTVAALRAGDRCEYVKAAQLRHFAVYLSFTGGPLLRELAGEFGVQRALPLYCSVDLAAHRRTAVREEYRCDVSYLGTYAKDRQPKLDELLLNTARRLPESEFIVAGPQYPADVKWSGNVKYMDHVPPQEHSAFYSSSRFTLNITRADMVRAGYSPSVRLFEAAACRAAMLSDAWDGIGEFFTPGEEIVLVEKSEDVVDALRHLGDAEVARMGEAALARIVESHTAEHRAIEFEEALDGVGARGRTEQQGVTA